MLALAYVIVLSCSAHACAGQSDDIPLTMFSGQQACDLLADEWNESTRREGYLARCDEVVRRDKP